MRPVGRTTSIFERITLSSRALTTRSTRTRREKFRRQLAIESLEERRLLAVGDLDLTFDSDGKLTFSFDSANTSAYATDVKSVNGKIVAVGSVENAFGVARFNNDGSVDSTFDGDGKAIYTSSNFSVVGENVFLATMNVAGASKIIVAGTTQLTSGAVAITLVRYNDNGSLDTSFDGDGLATASIPSYIPSVRSVTVDSQNRIVVGGWVADGFLSGSILVARFNSNGSLDNNFSGDGLQFDTLSFNFPVKRDYAFDVTVDNQDRIVAVGYKELNPSTPQAIYQIEIARFLTDGIPDTSFGIAGNAGTVLLANHPTLFEGAVSGHAVAVNSSGKIIVASNSFLGFRVSRLLDNGALDTSFGELTLTGTTRTGEVRYQNASGNRQLALAMQLDAIGRIVVAGSVLPTNTSSNTNFALSRFTADGDLDASFNSGVLVNTDVAGSGRFDEAYAISLDPQGKIILAGRADRNPSGSNAAIARYDGGSYGLSVTRSGSGKITSSPDGIDSSIGNSSANFADGTEVTLTATPAAGSVFTGWSGAAAGSS
ncbi:MAG: hypothetical protein SGI77_14115, partial [Pirellulaceae bacterium]|nr:hypothetical protein [Pirellulaceae bacterium]